MESGSITKQYRHILIPTVIGMLSNSLYCLVDVYFISIGSGSIGLAALNIAMPIYTLYSAIGSLLGVGGATLISIAQGSCDQRLKDRSFTLSMVLMFICGAFISLCGTVFVERFAYLLGASDELIVPTVLYTRPILITAIPFVMTYAISTLLRSDGNPKLAMAAVMVGNFSNIILDYIFVIVFHMGIAGASIATAISPLITVTIASLHFVSKRNTVHFVKDFYDLPTMKRMLSAGMGSGIMEISAGVVIVIFNAVILVVGKEQALAAYSIITNIAYVAKGALVAFAQASQPLIASGYGAKKMDTVHQAWQISLRYTLIFSILLYLLFLLFPDQIAGIFASKDLSLIALAANGICIYFSALVFMGINTVMMNYFQSIEEGRLSTIIALVKGFVFVLVAMSLFVPWLGLRGVWLVVPAAEMGSSLVCYWMYTRKYFGKMQ